MKKIIYMLSRRGSWYGPFGTRKNAEEFGEWKNWKDKQIDSKGMVHKMSPVKFLEEFLKRTK